MKITLIGKVKQKKYIIIIILIISFCIIGPRIVSGLINASLIFNNGTNIDYLKYDRGNQSLGINTYGSNSYMDHTITNPNLFLYICHPNLTLGDKIDIVYSGKNQSYFSSVLNFFPLITYTTNHTDLDNTTYMCSTIDVDLSSIYALYPGYIHPVIIPQGINYSHSNYNMNQAIFLSEIKEFLNGSYSLNIDISGLNKIYSITINKIYDEKGIEIEDISEPYLIISLVNSSDIVRIEEKIAPGEGIIFDGNFRGGEHIYVNEIDSLEILSYAPCGPINESGYYIFNQSATGLSDTCVTINNSQDIVLNFGGELLDGDGSSSGSFATDKCAILIENSNNVVIEYLRTQEFYYGICIKNSKVSVYGNYSSYNLHGAKVYDGSIANFYSIYFGNNNSEVVAFDNSEVNLTNVSFASATIKAKIKDAQAKTVTNPPPAPNIENLTDIDQYIEVNKESIDSYLKIGFYYSIPLPENVSLNDVSIYQYHGERDSNSSTGWEDANWTPIYTIIDPQQNLIMSFGVDEFITNFSVFAPFGFPNVTEKPKPEPEPKPTPTPSPTAGTSGNRGAQPTEIQLELDIPKNITLMQGEAGEIRFNISNIGTIFAPDVLVGPEVINGWEYTNDTIGDMDAGVKLSGEFQIAPHESTTPKEYDVPVNAYIEKDGVISIVTSKILKVIVIPRKENLARMRILEYPPIIEANPSSILDISFLAKNIGGVFLSDIIIEIEESACINNIRGKYNLGVDETKSLTYTFNFTESEINCDLNLKFYSNKKLIGFVPVKIILRKERLTAVDKRTYAILIFLMWTGLTAWIIGKKRKHKKDEK